MRTTVLVRVPVAQTRLLCISCSIQTMRFNWMLLSGTLGMLTTVAKDPDDGGKLQVAHMERNSTLAEISALKLEIVQLKRSSTSVPQVSSVSLRLDSRSPTGFDVELCCPLSQARPTRHAQSTQLQVFSTLLWVKILLQTDSWTPNSHRDPVPAPVSAT